MKMIQDIESLKLYKNAKFQLIPNIDKERTTFFVAGEAGAGKSHFAMNLRKQYHTIYPKIVYI